MPADPVRTVSTGTRTDVRMHSTRPNDVLALVTSTDPWGPSVDAAIALAARWAANLTGCYIDPSLRHAAEPDREAPGLPQLHDMDHAEHAAFASHAHDLGVRDARWAVARRNIPLTLRTLGAWHDLVVVEHDIVAGDQLLDILGEAMLTSRMPCLLLPPGWNGGLVPDRVAIGWNGSIEAARAVHCALPFLQEAAEVRIIDGQSTYASDDDTAPVTPRPNLLDYLRRHGVDAKSRHLDISPQEAGPVLLEEIRHTHAGLLVMGAYSHSCLRERVLGGATRHVLKHAHIPVLIHH